MTNIILCADDYGQNTAISQAIIDLLGKNRLSATSCIATSYYWSSHAKWLRPFANQVDIGMHFNLTEGKPLTKGFGGEFTSLSRLITKAYLSRLNRVEIELELHAQLDAFVAGIGRLPDFLDGHQHIQQLPVIREVILNVYEKRLRDAECYIRSVKNSSAYWKLMNSGYLKSVIIQLCGASSFQTMLAKRHIPHNASFTGYYDFSQAKKYAKIFPKFLKETKEKGLIMCHPGLKNSVEEDSIAEARHFEYQFFSSEEFMELLVRRNVVLRRFK